ncbi:MAG: diaminopimelate decarboxylase [Dehalococcoidia bacterium]|nr:diaminopimelate decarboxylase [Dehalococcoidia bacterium]
MPFSEVAHLFPTTARANAKGHLELGGCDATALAQEFGTPLYVFCEETLRGQCRAFLKGFGAHYPNVRVLFAGKAYINPALARIFRDEGLGLDVVSGGELAVAKSVSFPPGQVYFHGNNKSTQELKEALEYGVGRIVLDNLDELARVEQLAQGLGRKAAILVRVNPGIDPHTHSHTTTGILDSKFGFPLATGQAEQAVKAALASPHLQLVGLHFHLGSPIFELEPYAIAIQVVLDFAARLAKDGLALQEFSPGGGYAINYLRTQRAPAPEEYAEVIGGATRQGCEALGLPLPTLVLEPGRAIVGPAGVALYTVGSVKPIPGVRTYASVDGGMGDNIRPALYDAKYEVVAANRLADAETDTVTVAGKYCESGDLLVRDTRLPPLALGDLLALPAAGAYAPSMASTYNLNPRPAIVLVKNGRARLIRRRETYQDLMRNDVL